MPKYEQVEDSMEAEPCSEFKEDRFIEELIKLRTSDIVAYGTYPKAVRDAVEEYECEKEAAGCLQK